MSPDRAREMYRRAGARTRDQMSTTSTPGVVSCYRAGHDWTLWEPTLVNQQTGAVTYKSRRCRRCKSSDLRAVNYITTD